MPSQISLALDTSLAFAYALAKDGKLLDVSHLAGTGRESDSKLLPWLLERLQAYGIAPEEVTEWTLGTGPGSFAGLRCGIAMAKGVAQVSGARLRGIPTSIALAIQAAGQWRGTARRVGVLHDGRCGQVLLAICEAVPDSSAWRLAEPPAPFVPADLLADGLACDCWCTAQAEALPPLPAAVQEHFISVPAVCASPFLTLPASLYPWPASDAETEASIAPIYVRQAVFVKPATLRRQ